jgi:hypothetical protein
VHPEAHVVNPEPVAEAMHCHSAGINALASFKDGRWLVSGSDDTMIKIWQALPSRHPGI